MMPPSVYDSTKPAACDRPQGLSATQTFVDELRDGILNNFGIPKELFAGVGAPLIPATRSVVRSDLLKPDQFAMGPAGKIQQVLDAERCGLISRSKAMELLTGVKPEDADKVFKTELQAEFVDPPPNKNGDVYGQSVMKKAYEAYRRMREAQDQLMLFGNAYVPLRDSEWGRNQRTYKGTPKTNKNVFFEAWREALDEKIEIPKADLRGFLDLPEPEPAHPADAGGIPIAPLVQPYLACGSVREHPPAEREVLRINRSSSADSEGFLRAGPFVLILAALEKELGPKYRWAMTPRGPIVGAQAADALRAQQQFALLHVQGKVAQYLGFFELAEARASHFLIHIGWRTGATLSEREAVRNAGGVFLPPAPPTASPLDGLRRKAGAL